MPPLPVPQSNPQLPRPIFTGDQFGAAQGRALGQLGGAITDAGRVIQQRQAQRDVSRLNVELTKAQAELTVEWQERLRTADPNDDNLAADFLRDRVQARLSDIEGSVNTAEGREHFARLSAGVSAGFFTTAHAGQASLAETSAVLEFQQVQNQLTDAVSTDPMAFESSLAALELSADGLQAVNGLSSEARLKLTAPAQRDLALTAARGVIDRDPALGQELVESGTFSQYLDAGDKLSLINYSRSVVSAQEAAARAEEEKQASLATTEYLRAAVGPDGAINQSAIPSLIGQLVRDPRLASAAGADQGRTIFNLLDGLASRGDGEKSVGVFQGLWDRAGLPPGSPERPTAQEVLAQVGPGLRLSDAQDIIKRLDDGFTPQGRIRVALTDQLFKAAREQLSNRAGAGLPDPEGELAFSDFQAWAAPELQRLVDAGTPVAEIFAINGPLYGRVNQFQRSTRTPEARARSRAIRFGDPTTLPPPTPAPRPSAAPEGRRTVEDAEKFLAGGQ